MFASLDNFGLLDRRYRSWNGSLFVGDHFRATSAFSVDVGLRYERIGHFNDELGRNSSFNINAVDRNPPSTGSVAGYMVAANYAGTLPSGVIRADNDSATFGKGQNGFAPRIGFAWQPSRWTSRVVIRAGYGMYFSQPTGQAFFQSVLGAPFSTTRATLGTANAAATFSNPFAQPFPTPSFFPQFPAYSPTSSIAIDTVSPDLRPAIDQQYGMNVQLELAKNWMLEVGYFGTRRYASTEVSFPQSGIVGLAFESDSGSNLEHPRKHRVENTGTRSCAQFSGVRRSPEGTSWYNGLEISVTKRLSKGLQLLGDILQAVR